MRTATIARSPASRSRSALLRSSVTEGGRNDGRRSSERQSGPGPTADERFWPKVEKTESCWNWIGGKDDRGYGFFYFRGDTWRAHRVSLVLSGVDVPEGTKTSPLVIDHKCRNLACVNPEHLRIVSRMDNVHKYALRIPGRPGTPRSQT